MKKLLEWKPVRFGLEVGELYFSKRVSRSAAELAYFLILTFFPVLICINAFIGLLHLDINAVLEAASPFLPRETLGILGDYIQYITGNQSPALLAAGGIMTLFSASAAFRALMEGLTFGAGDAVLGLNPVDDSVESVRRVLDRFQEIKTRWDIPTQICVLAHVTTQMEAVRQGAPCDLIFQSIAGSQKGNEAFGLDGKLIEEARQLALREGTATGPNVMYFETGQGSELSSEAHHGADQVVMEARCYGFAKRFQPFLVNTVVGFIGPEYLYNSKQVIRAGLEDHFMGKLTGIPMGCDACYTNHMKADQNDIEDLAVLLTAAGCNYFMGIPHGDDVMLNYQTTGFHETAALRELYGLTAIPPFQAWLEKMGFVENGKLTELAGDASVLLA